MYEDESPVITDESIREAVIVAAHPDDEILWFSGIIEKVKQVVICYLHQESRPEWTAGRIKALAEYPLTNIHSLNLNVSDVFGCGDWQYPRITPFGMDVRRRGCSRQKYEANFLSLKNELQELLHPYTHVFTHNPWGEYGHEEHVQVFRVIESLQSQMGFTLWVPNYVSNRSVPLMVNSKRKISNRFFRVAANQKLAAQIRDLYLQHQCWTWYPDFQWRTEEVFLRINPKGQHKQRIGRSFPLNFLDVGEDNPGNLLVKKTDKLVRGMSRMRNRLVGKNPG